MTDIRVATSSQTVGPFFHIGLEPQPPRAAADAITVAIAVTDGDGRPVDDGLVELWNADTFARVATDKNGRCECPIARASYINVCFFARGLLRQLHTRIYFGQNASDAVLSLVPESRRQTLIAERDTQADNRWVFPLRLQGPHETVFFDV